MKFATDKYLSKKTAALFGAVSCMGFAISWLAPCGFGTDSFTALNLAASARLGLSFGSWQALLNTGLFILVLLSDRRQLGIGTLFNMFLVGYTCDAFSCLWLSLLPPDFFVSFGIRLAVMLPALLLFVFAAAVYMTLDCGVSPYDALPFILSRRLSFLPFRLLRIAYDLCFAVLALLLGGELAPVTLLMAFLLGPAVEAVAARLPGSSILKHTAAGLKHIEPRG